MGIIGLHIPHRDTPIAKVRVNERNAMSYYPYVQGGPVEAGYVILEDIDLVVYVNARYPQLDDLLINDRASALFAMGGVGMVGGAVKGDALVVRGPGRGEYERSLPSEVVDVFLAVDPGS